MTANAGKNEEKEEYSSISGGIANWCNRSGNQSGGSSEFEIILFEDQSKPLLHIDTKCATPILYGHVLCNVHSNLICKRQKLETTQMSLKEWIQKMWLIYTKEYYSSNKKEDIMNLQTNEWNQKIS